MKKYKPILIAMGVIVLLLVGYVFFSNSERGKIIAEKENEEFVTEKELFDVSGNEVRIFYNNYQSDRKGIVKDGAVYLPLDWVADNLNDKFYLDKSEGKVIYTYPDRVSYIDHASKLSSGETCLINSGSTEYISLNLVLEKTPAVAETFIEDEYKRIFIEDYLESYQVAPVIKKDTVVREGKSVSDRGVTTLAVGDEVQLRPEIWETTEEYNSDWVRVRTASGFLGYVKKKTLGDTVEVTPMTQVKEEEYTSVKLDGQVILGWHLVSNYDTNDYLKDVLKDASGINVISPTWFSLRGNEGEFESLASHDYVEYCHDRDIQVWALIDNFDESVSSAVLLSAEKNRTQLISGLMNKVKEYDIDGINIDFEQLSQEASQHYIQFLRELSIKCRKDGIVLSVDDPNGGAASFHYNREAQGECCDYVINMGYDEHYVGSEAGSVSSISFFTAGLQTTMAAVPPEKVIAGVPFYTRVWTTDETGTTSKALGIKDAQEWIRGNGIKLTWNDSNGQYYGERKEDSTTTRIWMEDTKSLKLKVETASELGAAGVAGWRLGMETPEVWDALKF